ncbi:hypothetical protein H9L39_10402 [Fusarium oxysporum f. sp. albedinis]|nr:hypothetical protein H9L39_10402 [Fusarium oxysporum f. sp. albedinis]
MVASNAISHDQDHTQIVSSLTQPWA